MPIIWTLLEHAVLLARDSDDDFNIRQFQDDDGNESNNHRRLEIGVIVAIVVAGLAVIGFVATCVIKRRRRAAKRAAKATARQIQWYVGSEEVVLGTREMDGFKEEGNGEAPKKVTFVGGGEGEAPPSYQAAVSTGDSKGDAE